MALTLSQSGKVALERNKEALAISASLTAGNIINERLAKIVAPKLPLMARGYADTPVGKAILSNAFASAITHFMPHNKKANLAAEAMVQSAMVQLVGEFDFEGMVNDLIDGFVEPVTQTEEGK